MRTELIYGSGAQRVCAFIDGFYKCGNVGIVHDGKELSPLTRALTSGGHKVKTGRFGDFNDSVRCIIAYGGRDTIKEGLRCAEGKILVAYPTEMSYESFLESERPCRYTIYIDSEIFPISDTITVQNGYLNAIIALSELYGTRQTKLPYRDVDAERTALSLKKLLLGEVDKTQYLETLTKAVRDAAALTGEVPLCDKIGCGTLSSEEKFFVCYLFFYFALLFTKVDFFGMLIPVGSREKVFWKGSDVPVSTEQLSCFAANYFALGGELDSESASEIFGMLPSVLRKSNGFFAELGNSGILEAAFGKW